MIDVPVYNEQGQQVDLVKLDEGQFGQHVRPALLKQAIVMYQANQRQGSAATKNRAQVEGSTRKIYRQKGTGRARMGAIRTPIRRGGGRTFAKEPRDFSKTMPKRMRRLARDNAILAKALSQDMVVIEGLQYDAPKTRRFASMLAAVGASGSCLVALEEHSETIWKSGRNIPKTDICQVRELNAYDILRRRKLVVTRQAFDALLESRGLE